ncbi:MAG: leucine-rich repeat protein, partial [Clostridia bacterium]|nr:leucine-rich repeat protein [Clostridia bacterium]
MGHSYTEWLTSVAPTCTTKGYSSSICERCLDTQTKVLIPLGHDLGADIVDEEAKCGVAGKKHNECSRCDYTEEDIIPAKNHDFADNTLNTCKNGCGAKIYEYTLVGESTTDITITKYNGDIKDLRIPERLVDGDKVYNVVAIGDRAFMGTYVPAKAATETTEAVEETFTTKVNTVVIPDSVTSIGAYAFANSGLKIATIPATVTSIGDNAFGYKVEIQLVDAPAANTPATTAEDGEGTTTAPEKVEKLVATRNDAFTTIYGDAKSAAETYVTKHSVKDATNNIAFVALSSVYTFAPDVKENDVTIIAKNADFKAYSEVSTNMEIYAWYIWE